MPLTHRQLYQQFQTRAGASTQYLAISTGKTSRANNRGEITGSRFAEIVFENVSFAYDTDSTQVARSKFISSARRGEVIALVGQAGGKNTRVLGLPRFLSPLSGGHPHRGC